MRRFVLLVAMPLGLAAAAGGATRGAAATGCAATMTVSGPQSGHLVLTPSHVDATVGDCIAFHDDTTSSTSIAVTAGGKTVYSATVTKGATTSPKTSFHPTAAGKDTVEVKVTTVLVLTSKGSGTVDVSAAASPTPTPSKDGSSPRPSSGRSPSPGSKPKVASAPKHHHAAKQHAKPKPTGIKLPPLPPLPTSVATAPAVPRGTNPLVAPGPTAPATQPSSTSSSPAAAVVVSGPIEPADDDSRGLPEVVGVAILLGLAIGWGRVLLAAAVDEPVPVARHG
jgi:plastocyanin